MKKFLQTGRVNQKAQTKTKILAAAQALMKTKKSITLEEIAKIADISRATMYRYYSNVNLLITEAALDIQHRSPEDIYEDVKEMHFEDRVRHIQKYYNQLAHKHEMVFRGYLSSVLAESVKSKMKLRGSRRVHTLEKALEPFKHEMNNETYDKLICAATILMGIDAVVVCKDVCGLSKNEIEETLSWALNMIIKGMNVDK